MKAIFISYNQALSDRVMKILDSQSVRGFTRWEQTQGRGTFAGEPHYGGHAWPSMNSSILTIVPDEKVRPLLNALQELDNQTEMQGTRAFVWDVIDQIGGKLPLKE